MLATCESLERTNSDGDIIKSGSLISINSMIENNNTRDHFLSVTQNPDSPFPMNPYAYIGLRKVCVDCNFEWITHEPLSFTNWYTGHPSTSPTSTWDCSWMWMTAPYFGKWTDFPCDFPYAGICQFYPQGKPTVPKPALPDRAGCKPDWWAFAGYCYKEFGLRVDDNGAMDTSFFKTYPEGNISCSLEWDGARMAIMPSRSHNALVAALLGPSLFGSDVWVGIYSRGTYDLHFRFTWLI